MAVVESRKQQDEILTDAKLVDPAATDETLCGGQVRGSPSPFGTMGATVHTSLRVKIN
jgi:hypothetical protein